MVPGNSHSQHSCPGSTGTRRNGSTTRNGLTDTQAEALRRLLAELPVEQFVHGSCRGTDVEAARLARLTHPQCCIVARPGPDDDSNRTASGVDDETLPGKTHFARNRDIVADCDLLIGCPPCRPLPPYGGTAYTVGHARKVGKPVVVVWPDGRVER